MARPADRTSRPHEASTAPGRSEAERRSGPRPSRASNGRATPHRAPRRESASWADTVSVRPYYDYLSPLPEEQHPSLEKTYAQHTSSQPAQSPRYHDPPGSPGPAPGKVMMRLAPGPPG